MKGNRIITIGREYGSAGKEIGEMLAKKLGINCYDKELIAIASKESGLCPEVFEKQDERPVNSFFYSLVMDTHGIGQPVSGYMDVPLNQKVFLAQFDTIQKLAKQESCVIVGRCADYALASYPNVTSIFICGDMEDKVKRVADHFQIGKDKAMDLITKTDKKRANYYNYYSNKKWGSAGSYDLCLNSTLAGVDGSVQIILEFIRIKEERQAAQ